MENCPHDLFLKTGHRKVCTDCYEVLQEEEGCDDSE